MLTMGEYFNEKLAEKDAKITELEEIIQVLIESAVIV